MLKTQPCTFCKKVTIVITTLIYMNIKDISLSEGTHIVILGAGASIASALRNPEKHHLNLPSMNDLSEVCGLDDVLCDFPQELICNNFEATYSNLVEYAPDDYKIGIIND